MTTAFDDLHTGKVARSFRLSEEDSYGVSSWDPRCFWFCLVDANFLHRYLKAHISWWHSEAAEQARCCKRNSLPQHTWTWSGVSFWLSPSSWIVVIPSKSSFLDWDPRGDLIRSEAIPDFHSVGKISKAVGKNAFLSGTFALHSSKYLHTVMKLARSAQYAAKVFPYITAYLR